MKQWPFSKRHQSKRITVGSLLLAIVGFFAYIIFFNSSAYANLVPNPGCDTSISGWTAYQGTLARSTSVFRSGGASCLVSQQTGNTYTIDDNPSTVADPVQGETYTATAWVRAASATGKPVRMAIRQWTSTSDSKTFSSYANLTTSWQQITVTATVASNTNELDVYVVQESAVAGNSFYVDDIQLVKTTASSANNVVENPGFESGLASWQPNVRAGSASITTTTSTKNGGAASAQINVTAAAPEAYEIELAQYGLPMTAGKTYTVSFWARANTTRSMDVVIQRGSSPYTEYMRKTVTLSTSWQLYNHTFLAPSGIADPLIGLQFGEAVGTYWVDDVLVAEGVIVATPTPIGGGGSTEATLVKAINFKGPDLNVDGVQFVSDANAGVSYSSSRTYFDANSVTLNPAVSANKATMIRSSVYNSGGLSASIPINNGTYQVYIYNWEDNSPESYSFSLEGQIAASNQSSGTAGSWRKLGPYTVTVADGALNLSQTGGAFNLSGMEIYTPPSGGPILTKAINFNGAQLDVDGVTFQAESAAGVSFPTSVTRFTNTSTSLNPSVSTNKTTMIRSSIWRGGNVQLDVNVALANGNYLVYLYSWEDTGNTTYNIGFEGTIVASALSSGTSGTWKKLGPYSVTVNDGTLSMFQTGGDFNLSGMEIYTTTTAPGPPTTYNPITYRSSGTGNNGTAATSLTLSKPAATVQGDVMLAQVVVGGAGTTSITAPTGWTLIRRDNTNSLASSALYSKVAGASEPTSYTWNFNSSQPATGGIATYYNVDTANPIDNHSGQFNDDNPTLTAPSVTATTPADKLLFFGTVVEGGATISGPSSTIARWTLNTNSRTGYMSERQLSASGATGNYVATHSRGALANLAQLVLLRPSEGVVPTSAPLPGSVANLNFFLTTSNPWVQTVCGDFRMDSGLDNPMPSGQTMMTTNPSCASPGIVFSGDSPASFGTGQASSTNQTVGGFTYPEVYTPSSNGGIFSSYNYLDAKAQSVDTQPINLATICTLSNCTLPANLPKGIYKASGDVTFNAYTFPVNQHYVFLIDGNMTVRGNIITPVSSSAVFSVSGNIVVLPVVGVAPAVTAPNLSGIFSTDRSFIIQSTNTCADLRLNFAGVLVVNAGQTGGSLQNERDLCGNNISNPSLQIVQRLDLVLNLPEFVRIQSVISNELSP